ncbi:meiosis-specific protein ASY1-like [Nicotiana tomentosiformis]|uniref:meiosis-specific protein ASY1-like n=1 Tax=Nicotiana tomentosiformis TaxID=4098 RepID=UPI00388CD76A
MANNTPADYEPPFFRSCTEEEAVNPWAKSPLKMEVDGVNIKHFVLALKVKSVLDPCEDEKDDNQDNSVSLGADSFQGDDSEFDSEFSHSDDDQYIVAPIDNTYAQDNGNMADEDDTQDPAEDEQQFDRLKEWINSYHLDRIKVTDVLSHFPDISEVLVEEIMEKLVKEGILSSVGTDCCIINKQKKFNYEFGIVKEEIDGQQYPRSNQSQHDKGKDYMYMKALYHALPLNYVTISNLQSKLGGEANRTTVKKLIDKMTQDGFVEAGSNRRLGKRVIHSDLTEKKLVEVKKVLEQDVMVIITRLYEFNSLCTAKVLTYFFTMFIGQDVDMNNSGNNSNYSELPIKKNRSTTIIRFFSFFEDPFFSSSLFFFTMAEKWRSSSFTFFNQTRPDLNEEPPTCRKDLRAPPIRRTFEHVGHELIVEVMTWQRRSSPAL